MSGARLPLEARGERPQYFADPAIDKVLSITLALAGEVAVLRERLDAVERLLEGGQPVTRAALDAYVPDAEARADRDAWREQFLDVILRVVHQEQAALARQAEAVAAQPAASQARAADSSAGTK